MRDIFGMEGIWREIDALDNRVPASLQTQMFVDAGNLMLRATLWFLRRLPQLRRAIRPVYVRLGLLPPEEAP